MSYVYVNFEVETDKGVANFRLYRTRVYLEDVLRTLFDIPNYIVEGLYNKNHGIGYHMKDTLKDLEKGRLDVYTKEEVMEDMMARFNVFDRTMFSPGTPAKMFLLENPYWTPVLVLSDGSPMYEMEDEEEIKIQVKNQNWLTIPLENYLKKYPEEEERIEELIEEENKKYDLCKITFKEKSIHINFIWRITEYATNKVASHYPINKTGIYRMVSPMLYIPLKKHKQELFEENYLEDLTEEEKERLKENGEEVEWKDYLMEESEYKKLFNEAKEKSADEQKVFISEKIDTLPLTIDMGRMHLSENGAYIGGDTEASLDEYIKSFEFGEINVKVTEDDGKIELDFSKFQYEDVQKQTVLDEIKELAEELNKKLGKEYYKMEKEKITFSVKEVLTALLLRDATK